jgi:hypothetical protein
MAKRRYLIRFLLVVATLALLFLIAQNGLHTRSIVGLIAAASIRGLTAETIQRFFTDDGSKRRIASSRS